MLKVFDSEKYVEDVQINRANIEEELARNPSILAYYIEQAALWSRKVDEAKIMRDHRAAEIYINLKDGGGKVTDGYIDATQKLDQDYKDYSTKLTLAREQLAHYEGAVTALEKKQFSLGSLNARSISEHNVTSSTVQSSPEDRVARRQRFGG